MSQTNQKRRHCPIGLELLEPRELLSGSPSRSAIRGASAEA